MEPSAKNCYSVVVGNPPFAKNTHLKVIDAIIPFIKDGGQAVFIHPARWYEDPLGKFKQNSDRKRFSSIIDRLENVRLLSIGDSCKLFDKQFSTDLIISTIGSKNEIAVIDERAQECIKVILNYSANHNLGQVIEEKKINGIRCPVSLINPFNYADDSIYRKKSCCNLFQLNKNNIFIDGFDTTGIEWVKRNGKVSGSPFAHSIRFSTMVEAENYVKSCNTHFYDNIIYLLKFDQHTPFRFLPWMADYSHVWTDKDYCNFFGRLGMSEDCQEWMCRDIDDYRIKDFVKYENMIEAA